MALTQVNGGMLDSVAQQVGFRNRIINGAMMIDQRNAGASVTPTASGVYIVDRWASYISQPSKLTYQQNGGGVTPPTGYKNYMGVTSTSAYSIASGEAFRLYQIIEGYNCADLSWGSSSASAVTLSFWVRSSLTGTFGGALYNGSGNRSYTFAYTVNSANTWEYKTITIAGDTSGTWATDNTAGIVLQFSLGAGSSNQGTAGSWGSTLYLAPTGQQNVTGTSGATFYITGVQLEKGSTATSFDYRPYGTELALCQRYYQLIQFGCGSPNGSTSCVITIQPFCPMRSSPTVGQTGVLWVSNYAADAVQSATNIITYTNYANMLTIGLGNFTGLTQLQPFFLRGNNANAITLSAEL